MPTNCLESIPVLELAIVDNIFRERKSRELMLSGVTIRRPETVLIDSAVKVGMDTVIEPFAQLLGSTVVGEDSVIGAGCDSQKLPGGRPGRNPPHTRSHRTPGSTQGLRLGHSLAFARTIMWRRTRISATSSS